MPPSGRHSCARLIGRDGHVPHLAHAARRWQVVVTDSAYRVPCHTILTHGVGENALRGEQLQLVLQPEPQQGPAVRRQRQEIRPEVLHHFEDRRTGVALEKEQHFLIPARLLEVDGHDGRRGTVPVTVPLQNLRFGILVRPISPRVREHTGDSDCPRPYGCLAPTPRGAVLARGTPSAARLQPHSRTEANVPVKLGKLRD
jgi:hypothetical protein